MKINPFNLLQEEWALLTSGGEKGYNTMTISWGALGVMWNKPTAIVFVRPQRYTKEFIDKFDLFTVSFFPEEYKKALGILGKKSGRNSDKISESRLTPHFTEGTVTFSEAHTVFVCKKMFSGQQLDSSMFADINIDTGFYPEKDYHHMYFGEIVKVLT